MKIMKIPFQAEAPQALIREPEARIPYPIEALGPLKDIVLAVKDVTQAPVEIAAQSSLSVASLAVQGFADVETISSKAPISLYTLTIAESGERKSSCDKLLMRAVREHEQEAEFDYNLNCETYSRGFKVWEKQKNDLINAATSGETSAEADLAAHPQAPPAPLAPNLTATEPTFEGLTKLFQNGRPSLGLFSDEAGAFIGGYAMNIDNMLKTCAGLSNLWDGSAINRTRAGDDTVTLYGRRLSTHLMAQPVAAMPLLNDPIATGQGFLARFLICAPVSNIGSRIYKKPEQESWQKIDSFTLKLKSILQAELSLKENETQVLEPRVLSLSEQAKAILIKYYNAIEELQGGDEKYSSVRSYASKSAEQSVRIAGVLTLCNDINSQEISLDTMTNAITLAEYYLNEAKRLSDEAEIDNKMLKADKLRKWLLDSWKENQITITNIVQSGPNTLRDSKTIKELMNILKSYGWVIENPKNTVVNGSKRRLSYQIVKS